MDEHWLRNEVDKEKYKISRFIDTQERRMDGMATRQTVLDARMTEKEKKVERTEKNLAKTRKEQSLILQAANFKRMT